MNDEIKEIDRVLLNVKRKLQFSPERRFVELFDKSDIHKLLDYITNLQQELKYQKEAEIEYNEKHTKLMEEYKRLKEENQRKDNIINELKNGIKELDDMIYETFRISQDGYFSISEWELKDFTDKIKELEKM